MTDKELIQALRCCVSSPKRDGCRSTCVFFNGDINWCIPEMGKAVSDRLEALLAENERLKAQVPKWRPASEPPEEYRDEYDELKCFLVCGNEAEEPYRALYDGKHWGDGFGLCDVKWWMPLPEPPSPEGVE